MPTTSTPARAPAGRCLPRQVSDQQGQTAFLMLRNHGEKRSHHTIKGGVILLYGHLILLKVMKSLHQCEQKSTTVLNISPLQIAPHLLSRITVQSRAHPEKSAHHRSRADGAHRPSGRQRTPSKFRTAHAGEEARMGPDPHGRHGWGQTYSGEGARVGAAWMTHGQGGKHGDAR